MQDIVNLINIAVREGQNNLGLKLDSKTSKSDKNGKYDSKHVELFVLTATGGIADLQEEGEQVNRPHTGEIPHPLDNIEPIHNATWKENVQIKT